MKVTVTPTVIGALGTVIKQLVKRPEDLQMEGRRDHPNYIIIKIDQNTEKCPGDLKRLAVTQNSSVRPSTNAGEKTLKKVKQQ